MKSRNKIEIRSVKEIVSDKLYFREFLYLSRKFDKVKKIIGLYLMYTTTFHVFERRRRNVKSAWELQLEQDWSSVVEEDTKIDPNFFPRNLNCKRLCARIFI